MFKKKIILIRRFKVNLNAVLWCYCFPLASAHPMQ